MASVYLETSFISALVTDRRDAGSIYRRQVSESWWRQQKVGYELFISVEVIAELSADEFRNRDAALKTIEDISVLSITDDVRGLAGILVREKAMPGPVAGDAIHVAIAAVYGLDYIMSWNVRHLANPRKADHLAVVCRRAGLLPPLILTPDMLWSDDT